MKSLRVSKDCKGGGKLTFLNILPRRRNLSLKKEKNNKPWSMGFKTCSSHTGKCLLSSQAGVGGGRVPGDRWKWSHLQLDSYRHAGPIWGRVCTCVHKKACRENGFRWVDGMVSMPPADSAHGPASPTCWLLHFRVGKETSQWGLGRPKSHYLESEFIRSLFI